MNVDLTNFTPWTTLTTTNIATLTIHSTRSSIRRAAAVKMMVTYPESTTLPTLYYIFDGTYTETASGSSTILVPNFTVHALAAEISKYLLLKSV